MNLFIAAAAVALLAVDSPLEKEIEQTRAQLIDAEVAIEQAKARVPFTADRTETEAALRAEGKHVGLSEMEIKFIPEFAEAIDGVELRRVDVSGRDSYQYLQRFLHGITFLGAVGIEELNMDAAPKDTVRYSARIVYPVVGPNPAAALERKPATSRDDFYRQILSAERDALQRRRATLDAFTKTAERINAANMVNALAAVAHAVEGLSLAMTKVRAGATTTFTGVALGAKNVDAVRSALKASGYELTSADVKPSGRCSAFVMSAKLTDKKQRDEVVIGNGVFDDGAAAVCEQAPAAQADVVVQGNETNGITLRLRNTDAATIFEALHDVSSENFVVDASNSRRYNVTARNATIGEILAQLRKAGMTISDGHVHRVSSAATSTAFSAQTWRGEPATLLLHDALFADIICLFHQITGMDLRLRRDANVKISVFATDVPWDEAMANIIATAGQRYTVDDKDKVYINPNEEVDRAAVDACEIASSPAGPARQWASHAMKIDDVGASDLTLAGVARATGDWKVYAFGPMHKPWVLDRGARLYDATVQSVGPEGAVLKTNAGAIVELGFR